ncbi:MAG: (2Fe-2S)-binding protein [Pseudonocardiaceae bacterium]
MPASAVDQLAELGPFFAIDTHTSGSAPHRPWRPMIELVEDPSVLMARVLAVRAALGAAGGGAPEEVELRVAASVTQLSLVARLVSPVLGVTVISGGVLDIDLRRTGWQPVLGGAFPLSLPVDAVLEAGRHGGGPEHLAALVGQRLLDGPVRALVEATRSLSVSPQVLWGNVASAVHGAATMIATARPAWSDQAHRIASLLLDQPPLRDTYSAEPDGAFRRRSCCLIYRAASKAAHAICGDCVLTRAPTP